MKYGLLRVVTSDGRSRDYLIDLPSLIVGRADGNSIVIDDLSVARRHARLTIDSGHLLVEDLGSAEGTFVGGHRIPANAPSLVETNEDIRFGEVGVHYFAPEALQPEPGTAPVSEEARLAEPVAELPEFIRANLAVPPQPIEAGSTPAIAYLTVHNRGRVVDELTVEVLDLPPEWVRISQPRLAVMPDGQADVTIIISPPRRWESRSGVYDFSVVVTSGETGREVLTNGQFTILPYESTTLTLRPVRSKKNFALIAENRGNDHVSYNLSAKDDEEAFLYHFSTPMLSLAPGEEVNIPFRVSAKKKKRFGPKQALPFTVIATAPAGDAEKKPSVTGQFAIHPPLQPFVRPVMFTLMALAILAGVLAYFFWPSSKTVTTADAEALYAGVHMCDKYHPTASDTPPDRPSTSSAAPLFKQNDPQWREVEYAKSNDPQFGANWCGSDLEQCGCGVTSVASVMAVFQLLTMPDGADLNPKTMNDWFNLDARTTSKGWVSRGYAYGDVVWTAVNQLSGEIAKRYPGAHTLRFARTGTGQEAEIRSELKAGRPVIIEVPGHWIAAIGFDGDSVLINDPYYKDRKTLDFYKDKILGTVLFEPSNDLSAIAITVPSNERVRVTDKEGRIVGTLNTGTPDEVKKDIQTGIPGGSYTNKLAWRDPTCVESPPPAGAGTNQIILPGAPDTYRIEVLDAQGGPTTVAIHTYDRNGNLTIQTQDNPGPAVLSMNYDPANPTTQISVIPGATPGGAVQPGAASPGPQPSPGVGPGSTNGSATASATAPKGSPSPTASASPSPSPSPTATATPAPPGNVTVTCNTAYSSPPAPQQGTVSCTTNIEGAFTTTVWSVGGLAVPAYNGKTSFSVSFDKDADVVVSVNACNNGACKSSSSTVQLRIPVVTATPTGAPTATPAGTATPTPASTPTGPGMICNWNQATVTCTVTFTGQYSSVLWNVEVANPPDAGAGVKTWSFPLTFSPSVASVTIGTTSSGPIPLNSTAAAAQSIVDNAFSPGLVSVSRIPSGNDHQLIFTLNVTATVCNYENCVASPPGYVIMTANAG